MRNWYKSAQQPQNIGVLLYSQFSNHCLANIIEPLRAANTLARKELYRWHFLTRDGKPVASSSNLPILPDMPLSHSPGGDFLFILTSYDFQTHATPNNARALRAAASRFDALVGMDTGSWLLAAAGLLKAQNATIHRHELTLFEESFPDIDVHQDRFVMSSKRITCGGAMAAFELVLELIGQTHGQALRLEVADLFMLGEQQTARDASRSPSGSLKVDSAVEIMRNHIEAPLRLPEIARQCGISQRKMETLFHQHLGTTPRSVYKRLRLLAARRYVEASNYSVIEIALRCGYIDGAAMTRAFVAEFGITPRSIRKNIKMTLPASRTS